MTDNKIIGAFKRLLAMTLALVMVLGAAMPLMTQESYAAFTGKKGSKYTVYDGGQIRYGSGEGGYSNSRKCDLGDDLGSRYSYCVQPAKLSPGTGTVTVDKVIDDDDDKGKWNALRNIIYYSPSYPGYDNNVTNIRSKYYTGTFSTDWGIAHLALSYVYAGRPSDMATFGGTHASDLGSVWTRNSGFENTSRILIELLSRYEIFDDEKLETVASEYITKCEDESTFPWRYYYIKYPAFRPGSFGKLGMIPDHYEQYMFAVLQTKSQFSENTYIPYLMEADPGHINRDSKGQRLSYSENHIICNNSAFIVRNNANDEIVDTIEIRQNDDGTDTENRVEKLRSYIQTHSL